MSKKKKDCPYYIWCNRKGTIKYYQQKYSRKTTKSNLQATENLKNFEQGC